jgi:tetratricopeptide (TPR) repeat protein
MIGERLNNITADGGLLLDIALLKIDLTTKEGRHIEISDNECQEILNNNQSISVEQLSRFAEYYYHIQFFEKGLNISHRILEIASNPYEKATGLFWKGLCLNFDKLDEKVKLLKEAVTILEPITNTKTNRLKSQLYNSLGEFHTRLAINEEKLKPVAVDYFNKSISIKKHPDTLDRTGMARSYGGLGRLELYVKPVNPAAALEYFEKDLELSKITGDFKGQVKMYSLIGACQVQICNFKEAVKNYSTSREMSTTSIDTFFALLGLLEISVKAPEILESDDITSEMLKLHKENSLPDFCLRELAKLIKQCPDNEKLSQLELIIHT